MGDRTEDDVAESNDDEHNLFVSSTEADQRRAAEHVLDKLRSFAHDLDELERATLAALLAPGIARAYGDEENEVSGFGLVEWLPEHLPDALARTVRDRQLRADQLDDL